jgi:transposase
LQTSDALGAAAAQLGPDVQAAVVELNKQGGLSHGKVTPCLESLFGLPLSRGGSIHTVLRAASRCEPVYEAIRQTVGQSDWVVPDATGWRVGGRAAWLHTLFGPEATAYVIDSMALVLPPEHCDSAHREHSFTIACLLALRAHQVQQIAYQTALCDK